MCGKPLLQWTVECARAATKLSRIIVSTDDREIKACALSMGVDVPFDRPAGLATDTAATVDVLRHALREVPGYDAVFTLQPTNPLRTPQDIDGAITLLESREDVDAVIGYSPVGERHPARMVFLDGEKSTPVLRNFPPFASRQDLTPCYLRNGAVYLSRARAIEDGRIEGRKWIPYVIPAERCWNIDEPVDLAICGALLGCRKDSL